MKKLLYKGIEFDDFELYDSEREHRGDYTSESLDGFESAELYICPCCVEKFKLYDEANTTKKKNDIAIKYLKEQEEAGEETHPICGVKGCNNGNSYDVWFDIEYCNFEEYTDEELKDFYVRNTIPYLKRNGMYQKDVSEELDYRERAGIDEDQKKCGWNDVLYWFSSKELCIIEEAWAEMETEYQFAVTLCDGYIAKGKYIVNAQSEEEAQEKALTEICDKLYKALPELDVEVSVSLIEDFEMENNQ